MKLIQEYKRCKIWYGEQYYYTGYLITLPNFESLRDMIRTGNTIKESKEAIVRLLSVYKEFGNPITANRPWIEYANKDKARIKELEQHIIKLNDMLNKI